MGSYNSSFYEGANYGLDPNYGSFLGMTYRSPLSQIGLATDVRTADQLKATSDKISTGARVAEIQLSMPEVAESIPNQHLEELNRLRKLTGTEFTVHGTLTEPTGVTKQGWNETHREQAERQMWTSLERAHKVDPTGNVVVTFHSSNGLPDPVTRVFDEKKKKEKLKEIWVVDSIAGQFNNVVNKPNFFTSEEAAVTQEDITKKIEKENEEAWAKALQHVNYNAHNGASQVKSILGPEQAEEKYRKAMQEIKKENVRIEDLYSEYVQGKDEELNKMPD